VDDERDLKTLVQYSRFLKKRRRDYEAEQRRGKQSPNFKRGAVTADARAGRITAPATAHARAGAAAQALQQPSHAARASAGREPGFG
jgi:hypothetical protein